MRERLAALVVTACLTALPAVAQPVPTTGGPVGTPVVYVCTADATVLRLVGNAKPEQIAAGTGTFDDCVYGPDGYLYISNGRRVVRIDPTSTARRPPAPEEAVKGLPSDARGLAFNGPTLYINTATSGVYIANGSAPQLAFPAHTGEGRGLAFEINGTFAAAYSTATGGSLQRAPFQYTPPAKYLAQSAVDLGGGSPRGIAVNTCGDVVYTDAETRTVGRVLKSTHLPGSPVASFGSAVPVNIEIDSSNRHYLLLADDDTGAKPRLVRADPQVTGTTGQGWISTCGSFTVTDLATLKVKNAVGLAIGPSAHRLVWQRNGSLEHTFDFGYHQASYRFGTGGPLTLAVTASRTLPSYVRFSSAFPAGSYAVPFSPFGGQAVELVIEASGPAGLVGGSYSYYTQEALGQAGIGRAVDHYVGPPSGANGIYTEDVQHDLWDLGDFDARSGEAENDFSKRVIYNAPTDCRVESFSQPFESQVPLFNGPQTIPLGITLVGPGCSNRKVRLSIVRLVDATSDAIEEQVVRSNVQTDNVFESLGNGRYKYVLDALSLNTNGASASTPAVFLLTIWGDVAPANRTFNVTK